MKFKYPDDTTKGVWVGGKTSSTDTWSSYEFYDGTNMGSACSYTECGEHSKHYCESKSAFLFNAYIYISF